MSDNDQVAVKSKMNGQSCLNEGKENSISPECFIGIELIRELAIKQSVVNRLVLLRANNEELADTNKEKNELLQILSLNVLKMDLIGKQCRLGKLAADFEAKLSEIMKRMYGGDHVDLDDFKDKAKRLNDLFGQIILAVLDKPAVVECSHELSNAAITSKISRIDEIAGIEALDTNAAFFPDEDDFLVDLPPNFEIVRLTDLEFSRYRHLDPTRTENRTIQRYEMSHNPRGLCLILNYSKYSDGDQRKGSELDVQCVSRLFHQLGFKVKIYHNLSLPKTIFAITEFIASLKAPRFLDSCAVVILAHGSDDFIYTSDYLKLNLEQDVLDQFENVVPGKPKIFMFQCCRGERQNLTLHVDEQMNDNVENEACENTISIIKSSSRMPKSVIPSPTAWLGNISKKLYRRKRVQEDEGLKTDAILMTREPMRSDMFIWYSTQPSFVSLRYPRLGGVFLQSVASVISKAAWCYDLSKLALIVNGVISRKLKLWQEQIKQNRNENDTHTTPIFQTPYSSNHLKKLLFFNPGYISYS